MESNVVESNRDTVVSLLRAAVHRHPSGTALIGSNRSWSFAGLYTAVQQSAAVIAEHVEPGDRVVVVAPNDECAVIVLLAIMVCGAIAVPVHSDIPATRLAAIARDCEPALILTDDEGAAIDSEIGLETSSLRHFVQIQDQSHGKPIPKVSADDVCLIFYTSGSTGLPKGVVCRHKQVLFCTRTINSVIGNRSNDVILCSLPLAFDYGFYQVLLALHSGATLVIAPILRVVAAIPKLIAENCVTGLPLVPSVIAALLHSGILNRVTLPSLRYITSTGDTLSTASIRTLREALPHVDIVSMYGLTECKRVSILPPSALLGREGSVGLPLPGTTVRVVGGDGRKVPAGAIGELYVRGPHVTDGYWNDPQETKERFIVDPVTGTRELRTGDLFKIDEDGFLYFVSRSDMLIKSHGERIGAAEVEMAIASMPGVSEVAVIGVPHTTAGQIIVAFVVSSTIIAPEDLASHCAARLPLVARPSRIFVQTELLPRTSNGKIDRKRLRDSVELERS